MRFQKRPITVEAIQWNGLNAEGLLVFTGGGVRRERGQFEVYDRLHDTWVKFEDEDWIIQGIQGEFYPCKRDVFEETYQPVGDEPPLAPSM